jgi:hypothetical protein
MGIHHEAQARRRAITIPEIKVTIMIPVHQGQRAPIGLLVQSDHRRDIRKSSCAVIEETTVPLASTP